MERFELGSEWRKWDLHVHIPGGTISDGYKSDDKESITDKFCRKLEESDVSVFGLTDYFSMKQFFAIRERFEALYPDSEKVLLPNLELRLPEHLNREGQAVNIHILFRPDIDQTTADDFCRSLKTTHTVENGKVLACSELNSTQMDSTTVRLDAIDKALEEIFGKNATLSDHALLIVSAKGDGIRPGGKGPGRKAVLADEIDKRSDAVFGNSNNREWFLRSDRLENKQFKSSAKPVFAGCDAHSFEQLDQRLGKHFTREGESSEITWIKADPTYEGLQQTLIEPSDRVLIQAEKPDQKDAYKVIREIRFLGSNDFPESIKFNSNLCSIIGSRSSGKSALLAYIAHTVDPVYTVAQQVAAGKLSADKVGPAAAFSWHQVNHMERSVVWSDPTAESGKIIYVPQNSLYEISEHPEVITAKILPALTARHSDFAKTYTRHIDAISISTKLIDEAIRQWFEHNRHLGDLNDQLKDLGDKSAIVNACGELTERIAGLKRESHLTDAEIEKYHELSEDLAKLASSNRELANHLEVLDPLIEKNQDGSFSSLPGKLTVNIGVSPSIEGLPPELRDSIEKRIQDQKKLLIQELENEILTCGSRWSESIINKVSERDKLMKENEELIGRNRANTEMEGVLEKLKVEEDKIRSIDRKLLEIKKLQGHRDEQIDIIQEKLREREASLEAILTDFHSGKRVIDELVIGVEKGVDPQDLVELAEPLNKNAASRWITKDDAGSAQLDLAAVRKDPDSFLSDIATGIQKIKRGFDEVTIASSIFKLTEEIRFSAILDDDRIGGFSASSMTPGKQALFALTLILNEAQEPWPLLIDQPEDDLDSRSIYEAVVPYLVKRKKERQIIMVSHNANLVMGADSEQIIVANRHGSDRRNKDDRTFDYKSGSLEHSAARRPKSRFTLDQQGTSEHACLILDGGHDAFQKRKNKYKFKGTHK